MSVLEGFWSLVQHLLSRFILLLKRCKLIDVSCKSILPFQPQRMRMLLKLYGHVFRTTLLFIDYFLFFLSITVFCDLHFVFEAGHSEKDLIIVFLEGWQQSWGSCSILHLTTVQLVLQDSLAASRGPPGRSHFFGSIRLGTACAIELERWWASNRPSPLHEVLFPLLIEERAYSF